MHRKLNLTSLKKGSVFLLKLEHQLKLVNFQIRSFNIYFNSKLLSVVNEPKDSLSLQNDLDRVCESSNTWSMKLNVSKCKILHFGKKNARYSYFMGDDPGNKCELKESILERDLGVIAAKYLRWKEHISTIENKANRILVMFKRASFCLWKDLYVFLARPHVEYTIQAWNPFL